MRWICFHAMFLLTGFLWGQIPMQARLDLDILKEANGELPPALTSSRTMVVFASSSENKEWQSSTNPYHASLIRMGIDPVLYVNIADFYANEHIRNKFLQLIAKRRIRNTIFIIADGEQTLLVAENLPNGRIDLNGDRLKITGSLFSEMAYQLGLKLKSADLPSTNFLTLSKPEFVTDVDLFSGRSYANYPGIIQRQKIGYATFQEKKIPTNASNSIKEQIEAFNLEVQENNKILAGIIEQSGFEAIPLAYRTNEEVRKEGVLYILMIAGTHGTTLRSLFNYQTDKRETRYISVTPGPIEGAVTLKHLESHRLMYKVYLLQVNGDDVFIGKEWDADENWESAVRNFLFTYYRQFE